ncbi:hypothetical protein NKH77_55290 [Streptomyces sp. M19]
MSPGMSRRAILTSAALGSVASTLALSAPAAARETPRPHPRRARSPPRTATNCGCGTGRWRTPTSSDATERPSEPWSGREAAPSSSRPSRS